MTARPRVKTCLRDTGVLPLISVLLPVWNAAATLPACLRSLQRQTEQRWQCVLIDDGSEDGSLACARWFAAQEARFAVWTRMT